MHLVGFYYKKRNEPCDFFYLSKTHCSSLWLVHPRGWPVRKSQLPSWVRMLPVPTVRLPWVREGARLQGISKQLRRHNRRQRLETGVTSSYRLHQDRCLISVLPFSVLLSTLLLHELKLNPRYFGRGFVRNLLLVQPGSSDDNPPQLMIISETSRKTSSIPLNWTFPQTNILFVERTSTQMAKLFPIFHATWRLVLHKHRLRSIYCFNPFPPNVENMVSSY